MRMLPFPAWHANRTSPIDERDMVEVLARVATADGVCGCSLDVGTVSSSTRAAKARCAAPRASWPA